MTIALGRWDPAGLRESQDLSGNAATCENRANLGHGYVAWSAALEKHSPELFRGYKWVGAMGSGKDGGTLDIYKVIPMGGNVEEVKKEETQLELKKKPQQLFNQRDFSWKKILHPMLGDLMTSDNSILTETPFTQTSLRLYTDHRVMTQIVIPGVSHISLMAATAMIAGQQMGDGQSGKTEDECGVVTEVLFERPYFVHRGAHIITHHGQGADLNPDLPADLTLGPGSDETGAVMTYCRAATATRAFRPCKVSVY